MVHFIGTEIEILGKGWDGATYPILYKNVTTSTVHPSHSRNFVLLIGNCVNLGRGPAPPLTISFGYLRKVLIICQYKTFLSKKTIPPSPNQWLVTTKRCTGPALAPSLYDNVKEESRVRLGHPLKKNLILLFLKFVAVFKWKKKKIDTF